jgi:hypothetical protein
VTRALLLVDGGSDAALGQHLTRLASSAGFVLDVVTPDLSRLTRPPGRQVEARVESVLAFDPNFDLVLVHRDGEGQDPGRRREEVALGVAAAAPNLPSVAVVPVRMTEAWLLTDDTAIRRVAGRPSGTAQLAIPPLGELERDTDPKATLRRALETASGLAGRHLRRFRERFGHQRRQLLESLDPTGPVSALPSWQRTRDDLIAVLS